MKTVITKAMIGLFLATPAMADVYLVSETDNYVFYADDNTLKTVAPGKTRVWLDIVRKTTASTDGSHTEKRLVEFDCGKDTYRMISGVEYDADGGVLDTYNYKDNLRTLDVVPDSAGASQYDFACTPTERAKMFALPEGIELVRFTRELEKVNAAEAGN
jgi:hypothetical protein